MSVSSSNERSGRSPSAAHGQEPRVSCVTCKKRKVRCDKSYPCTNCARRHIECVYLTAGPRRARGPGKQRAGERIEQMTSRVAQLEHVLGKLQSRDHVEGSRHGGTRTEGSEPPPLNDSGKADSVQTTEGENGNNLGHSKARLSVKEGKSHYIRNNFWATINEEVSSFRDCF